MYRAFLVLFALLMLTGIVLGAFGAHGLRGVLSDAQLETYRTGVDYHIWNALGLGLIGLLLERFKPARLLGIAGWFICTGIVLFSGSLYLLSTTGIRWLAFVTPAGGLAFIIGWALVAIACFRLGPNWR
jgi:uncharacterized membrane protein YgdD (TMEM256/DUF423 family)